MRTSIFLILVAFTLSLFGQGNTIDWRDGRPGVRVVTNSLQTGEIMGLIDVAGQAKAGTGDVARIEGELVTHTDDAAIHLTSNQVVRIAQEHGGGITNEQDLGALRTYHYGSPDIVESPAEWFVFDGAGTITAFNWQTGRENVVIPWEIGGVPVTAIGNNAFRASAVVSLIAPQTVTSIEGLVFYDCPSLASVSFPQAQTVGGSAFYGCDSLASVSLPQAQTMGNSAFANCGSLASVSLPQVQTVGAYAFWFCDSLTSVSLPQAQTVGDWAFESCDSLTSVYFDSDAPAIGVGIFGEITPNQVTNYVTNPQATGWGATFAGMPVVRLPLYADAVYQAGELVATEAHVAEQIADYTTFHVVSALIYSNSVSQLMIYTNSAGAATSWWSVARGVTNSGTFASDGGSVSGAITNGQTGPLTLGSLTILANGNVGLEGNSTPSKPLEFASTTGEKIVLYKNGGYSLGVEGNEMRYNITASLGRYTFNRGTAYATPNELFRVGPTLGIHTPGYVGIGPTISGKQAHIFTDGTNCFFVNVNSVTNALTTN